MAEEEYRRILDPKSLKKRGIGLTKLSLDSSVPSVEKGRKGMLVTLKGDCCGTRIRQGDRVQVEGEKLRAEGSVRDISFRNITVELARKSSFDRQSVYSVILSQPKLYAILFKALRDLRPGSPGYGFAAVLHGERPSPGLPEEKVPISESISLDKSQQEALELSLGCPQIFGVQGPPGTGKTRTLAIAAHLHHEAGRQTVITAFTHQAVDNALREISGLFPDRTYPVIKIGTSSQGYQGLQEAGIEEMGFKESRRKSQDMEASKPILGMTVHSGIIHLILKKSGFVPDVLLVDEAGQVPLPLGILLGRFWAGSIQLFGDDAQMPPVFSSDMESHPLSVSLFTQLRKKSPHLIRTLQTTYRLNHELTELIGQHFYPEPELQGETFLKPYKGNRNNYSRIKMEDAKIFFLEKELVSLLEGFSFQVRIHDYPGSYQENRGEAEEVARLISFLTDMGYGMNRLAVVSPYRRQGQLIRNLLQEEETGLTEKTLPIIDTVERIQGLSRDIILVSLGCSNREAAARSAEFLFSPNRLNVSLSRSRQRAILFCSQELMNLEPQTYKGMVSYHRFMEIIR